MCYGRDVTMEDINNCIHELRIQISKGKIQKGYRAILEYMLSLQSFLRKEHKDYSFPGSFYHGYMDMSYFAFVPSSLEGKGLKIAIVFNYEAFRFEIWLSGYNKDIQKKYWEYSRAKEINGYYIPETIKGYDSIVEDHIEMKVFDDEKTTVELVKRIETFVKTIENSL